MTRNEKLLAGLDLRAAACIEIGALDRPIVPPSSPHVFYVDHADTPALRAKYKDDPHTNVDNIVEVSAVWGGKSLAESTLGFGPVDAVVASHVIEHVPDLVTWLDELASVLKPQGEVRLAIPDRRYTFDVLRNETRIGDVLAAYMVRARRPQPREILDFLAHQVPVHGLQIWQGIDPERMEKQVPLDSAMSVARDSIDNGVYHDVHCWVFTLPSFATLMLQLAQAGLLRLKCVAHWQTAANEIEFFVHLRLCVNPDEAVASWAALCDLLAARREVDEMRREIEAAATAREKAQAMKAQLEDTLRKLDADRERISYLEGTVEQLLASTSWRVTKPLRALKDMLVRA